MVRMYDGGGGIRLDIERHHRFEWWVSRHYNMQWRKTKISEEVCIKKSWTALIGKATL